MPEDVEPDRARDSAVLRPGGAEERELVVVEAADDAADAEGPDARQIGSDVPADARASADRAVEAHCGTMQSIRPAAQHGVKGDAPFLPGQDERNRLPRVTRGVEGRDLDIVGSASDTGAGVCKSSLDGGESSSSFGDV